MASLSGTSTTSVTIGTGTKSFATQPGLAFFTGGNLTIASTANPAVDYMVGIITSYDTTTGSLTASVSSYAGAGTHTDWIISVAGFQGVPGTVVAVSVASANGFTGTSSGGGSPQLTLTTSVNGMIKGNGSAMSMATSGTDYAPGTSSLATGILKSTTATGALSIAVPADFPTLNQDTTGNAATVTTNANLTGPITSTGNATNITDNSITEAKLLISNNTTANVSASAHGFAPRLPNDATKYLDGTGNYTAPPVSLTIGSSATSVTIGTGSKTFTTQSGLSIAVGQFLMIISSANVTNYMFGQATSYSSTTLIVDVTAVGGSGAHTDWNIVASGPQGNAGAGSGIVNSGTSSQLAYYGSTGTTISGNSNATISSGALTLGSVGTQGSVVLSGSTSGTTTIVPVAAAGSSTVTIPNISTMLVGRSTTDTLTNKTLTAPVISTIVNTGTLTLPTSTDTLVGRSTTDTLSNKTLVAPALGTPASGVLTNCTGTAAGLTSGAANAINSASTTITVNSATAPSSGQVLTATGSTSANWQQPVQSASQSEMAAASFSNKYASPATMVYSPNVLS